MSFREVAAKVLGRDTLQNLSDEKVHEYLDNDRDTLRADMGVSTDEFKKVLQEYETKGFTVSSNDPELPFNEETDE